MTGEGDPKHVLAVHPGAEHYGSDRMFAETVRGLVEAGHQVTAVLPGPGPLWADLEQAGAQVTSVPMPVLRKSAMRPAGMAVLLRDVIRSAAPITRLLRTHRPRAVYVSTVTVPIWLLAGRLARARVTCHVHEAECGAARPVRAALAAPLLLAHEVIFNSRFTADVTTDSLRGRTLPATVVPNGVAGPATPATPPRATLDGPVRLVFIGRLSPRKGPDIAVRALRTLRAAGTDATLTLVGSVFDGYAWFEEELRRDAAEEIASGAVTLRGFSEDIWTELTQADIALVPSVMAESFGNSAAEAILARRPVVVSDLGGLPEAVDNAPSARLCRPDDPTALATAVQDLIDTWTHTVQATHEAHHTARERLDPRRYRSDIAAIVLPPNTTPEATPSSMPTTRNHQEAQR